MEKELAVWIAYPRVQRTALAAVGVLAVIVVFRLAVEPPKTSCRLEF
jgi:hypothetical protein